MGGRASSPPPGSIEALVAVSDSVIRRSFSRQKPLRPSETAKQMLALAKHLRGAAKAADQLGDKAIALIVAASNANRDGTDIEIEPHIHYLEQMAIWAEMAASESIEFSSALRDDKGGRTPDARLRYVITILMNRFQDLLAFVPTHTIDPQTNIGVSIFDLFVKEALRCCAPAGLSFEPGLVDETIRGILTSRSYEPFAPPGPRVKRDDA